jgi:flavin-dependent dehydrogenase
MGGNIDAVVVGAGPAGCAAAATLARLGFITVVLTGGAPQSWLETAPAGIIGLLARLGLPERALRGVAGKCRWDGAGHDGFHINRRPFDTLLRDAARRAGAHLHEAWAASAIRDAGRVVGVRATCGQMLSCRLLIAASGSRGWLGRQIGLRAQELSPRLIAWRGEVGFPPDGTDDGAARFLPRKDGWLFLATWNGRTTWTAMGHGRGMPDLSPLPEAGRSAAWNVSWKLMRPVAGSGWLLAGEAAGRLDPASGQGLLTAIASGIAAARTAAACLTQSAREATYLAAYDGWFADHIHEGAATLRQRYADNGIDLLSAEPAIA